MNKIATLSILSILSFSLVASTLSHYPEVHKIIYGFDNRMEVFEAPSQYSDWASATAAMVKTSDLKQTLFNRNFKWLPSVKYEERFRLCSAERFVGQPTVSNCSGFLVAPDILVTAGHCAMSNEQCLDSSWIFDYNAEKEGLAKITFPSKNIFKCAMIIATEKNLVTKNDYAVIRLDRPVVGRIPLKVRLTGKIEDNTELLLIGHPSFLPTKIVDGGSIRVNIDPVYFVGNIDSFAGNSGSPVMDAKTGVVEGILVRGGKDFNYDSVKNCYTTNVCEEGDCRGEDVTRITNIANLLQTLIPN